MDMGKKKFYHSYVRGIGCGKYVASVVFREGSGFALLRNAPVLPKVRDEGKEYWTDEVISEALAHGADFAPAKLLRRRYIHMEEIITTIRIQMMEEPDARMRGIMTCAVKMLERELDCSKELFEEFREYDCDWEREFFCVRSPWKSDFPEENDEVAERLYGKPAADVALEGEWSVVHAEDFIYETVQIMGLERNGFNRWTKHEGGLDRLYINAENLGLECDRYGTGNVKAATFDGKKISNSKARWWLGQKTYIDLKDWKIYGSSELLKKRAREKVELVLGEELDFGKE